MTKCYTDSDIDIHLKISIPLYLKWQPNLHETWLVCQNVPIGNVGDNIQIYWYLIFFCPQRVNAPTMCEETSTCFEIFNNCTLWSKQEEANVCLVNFLSKATFWNWLHFFLTQCLKLSYLSWKWKCTLNPHAYPMMKICISSYHTDKASRSMFQIVIWKVLVWIATCNLRREAPECSTSIF